MAPKGNDESRAFLNEELPDESVSLRFHGLVSAANELFAISRTTRHVARLLWNVPFLEMMVTRKFSKEDTSLNAGIPVSPNKAR